MCVVGTSLMWGAVAASSLLIGAVLALLRTWSDRVVGFVLAFGAGALIASVSFELAEEGVHKSGAVPVAAGLALGALAFFLADRALEAWGKRHSGASGGLPLALGALLDGIPEQLVLGIGLAAGEGVSAGLLVAIFLSNLPEAIGSSADMKQGGKSGKTILLIWASVTAVCTAATVGGHLLSKYTSDVVTSGIDGFAAGALLVMLIDSMIPEAREKAKDVAGLATVVGFALAAGLSLLA